MAPTPRKLIHLHRSRRHRPPTHQIVPRRRPPPSHSLSLSLHQLVSRIRRGHQARPVQNFRPAAGAGAFRSVGEGAGGTEGAEAAVLHGKGCGGHQKTAGGWKQ
jgi:hypothetical protein